MYSPLCLWILRRHSHTEVADRLFAMMKQHFESDSNNRVKGLEGFEDMVNKFMETFESQTEELLSEAGTIQTQIIDSAASPTHECHPTVTAAIELPRAALRAPHAHARPTRTRTRTRTNRFAHIAAPP
jgi:hypothetical protein